MIFIFIILISTISFFINALAGDIKPTYFSLIGVIIGVVGLYIFDYNSIKNTIVDNKQVNIDSIYQEAYKKGQVDYMNGKIKYKRFINDKGEIIYIYVDL